MGSVWTEHLILCDATIYCKIKMDDLRTPHENGVSLSEPHHLLTGNLKASRYRGECEQIRV